jgi:iron complex outermembrane receptor protein
MNNPTRPNNLKFYGKKRKQSLNKPVPSTMKIYLTLLFAGLYTTSFSQTTQDTTTRLKEVVIRPYFSSQPLMRATGAISLIDPQLLQKESTSSLLPAVNTSPGVRMEERSPGSYRLSIRGSLLRSPFGIRNVKIYFDEFPLTDAGGNSYLNALDVSAVAQMQILKGPQSSIYGANSGGVVLLQSENNITSPTLGLRLEGGAFGAFHEVLSLRQDQEKYQVAITQAYQTSQGYRDNSAMHRNYFQIAQKLKYASHADLQALIFYSDLNYQTPGGLTAAQAELNPRGSRPAAGAIPSAAEQHAGILSKTLFGGISNQWQISPAFKHVISVFSSYTDFKNPFITNYEHRKEFTLGLRTYLQYDKKATNLNYSANIGFEGSGTAADDDNFDNELGTPTNVQASDKLKAASNFGFVHLNIDLYNRLLIELSASANLYKYNYESIAPVAIAKQSNSFDVQFMPRIALSYLLDSGLAVRASISRGYSPPTLAEVRASNNVINTNLQPESGWNYETGIRLESTNHRIVADVAAFYYNLNNAIVRRLDEGDAEFFINAGGTKQFGIEGALQAVILPYNPGNFIRSLQLRTAYTYSHFKFDDYIDRTANYTGNDLTGVPRHTVVSSLDLQFPEGFYFFLQHNYTATIPLNDANTVYAKKFNLVQSRIGWTGLKVNNSSLDVYAGVDNLFNENYSLGSDLNALGGRYFNPAARRNFYAGLSFRFNRQPKN